MLNLRLLAWSGAIALFLTPLAAMQLSPEVHWGSLDFMAWGAMILTAGICFELAVRASANAAYRVAAALALANGFLLVWANLAVGIVGNEDNAANLLFMGLIALGVIGGALVRFAPHGMARVLGMMAAGQAGLVLLAITDSWVAAAATGFFALLWLLSAALFGKAAREEPVPGMQG